MARLIFNRSTRSVLPVVLLAVFVVAAAGTANAAGTCTSADVGEPFLLPDGALHSAGRITLCLGRDYTPVTSLHRTFVDNLPVGLFSAHRGEVDGDGDGYYLIFERRRGSTLRLVGYSVPSRDGTETFLLDRPAHVKVEDSIGLFRATNSLIRIAAARVH